MTISAAQFRPPPPSGSSIGLPSAHLHHHHSHSHSHQHGRSIGGGAGGGGALHRSSFLARQASVDVGGENGCCLVKALISNLLQFATRSRRKGADLATGGKEAGQRLGGPGGNTAGGCGGGGGNVCPVPETTVTPSSYSACTSANKKTGVVSFSQVGSAKSARKTVQSVDTCVADSFDEQMIDKICALPTNMDKNEWLAAHVLALFEHVNGISCTLSEICTPVTCPIMNFPGNQKVQWMDERGKRHNYSAMRYIDSVMSFCEASRTNQSLFPTKYGVPFSSEFESHCTRMVRLLWHCLGHMYSKHWEHLGSLNLRPQFGLVLVHLARLAKMYGLMQEKELASMHGTLQLARPSNGTATPSNNNSQQNNNQPKQQQRPLKRGLDEGSGGKEMATTATANAKSTVQARIQQKKQQAAQQQAEGTGTATMAMKSGSWGGHSQAAAVMAAAAQAANCPGGAGGTASGMLCQPKCYAQTC